MDPVPLNSQTKCNSGLYRCCTSFVNLGGAGFLDECRYLLHDRDTKYTQSFRQIIESGGVEPLRLPPRSPNLNVYAERWVKSVKDECVSKLIFFVKLRCGTPFAII